MQKFIKYFFKNFIILMAAYHVIVTILWYGLIWWNSQTYISFIRDALWILFIWIIVIKYCDQIKSYMKKWWKVRLRFIILIVFWVWISFLKWVSLSNIMIWIKYGFWYLVIFLCASFVWFTWMKEISWDEIKWFQRVLMFIVIVWFVWQILKLWNPEFFMEVLGYGKLDDFYYWAKPPLYYLTGYEWTMRWQWVFSGPNNYGYFLIAFLPLIMLWCGWTWNELKEFIKHPKQNLNFLLTIIWIIAIGMTLSRSALIWLIFIIAMLSKNWIKRHKKASIWILLVAVAWIVWLSFLKSESTLWHLNSKFAYVWEIIDNPLWHGLGSSGPAVHHEWTMLPENYFMQIMLDIWTVWFIFWAVCILYLLLIFKNIENHFEDEKWTDEQQAAFLQRKRLYLWWTALLIIWLFLHVFEDSMVNYLFFGIFGLLTGYLSQFYKKSEEFSIKELFKKN